MIKLAVNFMTFLRIPLSMMFAYYIINSTNDIFHIVTLFIIIFITDYFDGRMARELGVSSKKGAIFDVIADLFFISSSYAVLIIKNMIPVWMLVVVLIKFFEFCITSFIGNKTVEYNNSPFIFDILGKTAILAFYTVPVIAVLLRYYLPGLFYQVIYIMGCILTIMTFISSFHRIKTCLTSFQLKKNYGILIK